MKRIMSLALVVVMAVSTMAVASFSTLSKTDGKDDKFAITLMIYFNTAGSNGESSDEISVKF